MVINYRKLSIMFAILTLGAATGCAAETDPSSTSAQSADEVVNTAHAGRMAEQADPEEPSAQRDDGLPVEVRFARRLPGDQASVEVRGGKVIPPNPSPEGANPSADR